MGANEIPPLQSNSPTPLQGLHSNHEPDTLTVCLEGDVDTASGRNAYTACIAGGANSVVVDLSRVTFLDSAGYGMLVAARNAAFDRGANFALAGAIGQVAQYLALVEQSESIR